MLEKAEKCGCEACKRFIRSFNDSFNKNGVPIGIPRKPPRHLKMESFTSSNRSK